MQVMQENIPGIAILPTDALLKVNSHHGCHLKGDVHLAKSFHILEHLYFAGLLQS